MVRVEDRASNALRRIAHDVGGVSGMKALQARSKQLAIDRQSLQATRQRALNEMQSLSTGQRALALERQRANVRLSDYQTTLRKSGALKRQVELESSILRNQAQQSALTRRVGKLQALGVGSPLLAEAQLRLQAAAKSADALKMQEARLAKEVTAANAAIKKQSIVVQELAAREANAIRRTAELASTVQLSTARLGLNAEKMGALNKQISNARWDKLAAGGRVIQHTSRLFGYAGLIIGGSLGYMASAAAKFNTESTLAATQATNKWHQTADGVIKVSTQIQHALLDMAAGKQTTAAMQDNQKAIYDIFSSMTLKGNQRSQIKQGIDLLKIFNQAAIAGQVDVADVTHAGITILNNFAEQGKQVQQTPKLLQRMFAAVRFGRMTVTEFVGSLNQVAPAFGTAFGRSPKAFDQLSAAMATLTRQMPSVRMAATGLARLTEMFQRPDFVAGLKKSGLQITDTHNRLLPFNDVIDMIAKKFPNLKKGGLDLANFFKTMTALGSGKQGTAGTIQGRRALQELILNQKQYHTLSRQVIGDNNEFTKSFLAMSKTPGVQWKLFVQQMHAFAIEIGTAVIPIIIRLAKPLMDAVKWFNNLSDSTKNQIGRVAAWTAVILLAVGALSMLAGTAVRLLAVLGKTVGPFGTLVLIAVAASAAINALNGNWRDLNGIVDTFVRFGTGSIAGWVTMLGLAAVAALKLRGALIAVEVAGSRGGVMSLLAGTGGFLGRSFNVARFGGMKALFAGLAGSAGLISGSLLTAGGAIGIAAGAALLWKHHMDEVRKDAEAIARAKALGEAPGRIASKFGGLADATAESLRAKAAVDSINKQIAAAKKGGQKDQLATLYLDRYDALSRLDTANKRADNSFNSMNQSISKQADVLRRIGQLSRTLQGAQGKQAGPMGQFVFGSGATGIETASQLEHRIGRMTKELEALRNGAIKTGAALAGNFTKAVQGLSRMGQLPKLDARQVETLFRTSLGAGRALTLPEMRAIIKGDPKSLRALTASVRRAVAQARVEVNLSIKQQKAANDVGKAVKGISSRIGAFFNVKPNTGGAVKESRRTYASIAKIFKKNIAQHITISPGPAAARAKGVAIGAAFASGAANGISNSDAVIGAAVKMVDDAAAAARAHAGIKSPSTLFANTVGKPIGQGIAMGILMAKGDIVKAAALTIDLFQGSVLSNIETGDPIKLARAQHSLTIAQNALNKKNTEANRQRVDIAKKALSKMHPVTAADLTKDLQSQLKSMRSFNTGLATLQKRHVPAAMLQELRDLGVSGADNIALLARMTKPQLAKYVALWRSANKEVTKSTKFTAADVKAALKSMASEAAQSLLDTYNGFKDTNTQNFGDLFNGPTGLADKIGSTFDDALTTYNNSLDDYRNQIKDLNKQLADVNTQVMVDAIASFSSSFGNLFSGEWLTGTDVQTRIDWGVKLGFDDLFKDLQTQVDRFNHWRKDLSDLAGKVPADLAKQLEALGPEAVDKLDILNSSTTDQLSQYVSLWQQAQGAIGDAATKSIADNSSYTTQVADIMAQIASINDSINTLVAPSALTSGDLTNDINAQISAWGEYQGTLDELIKRGLPLQLIQQLQTMGPQAEPYLKALNSMTDTQLTGKGGFVDKWQTANKMIVDSTNSMMGTQLKIWYQYGADSAAQIIAGVGSQQASLLAYFTNLFSNLLQGKTPTFNPGGGGTANTGSQGYVTSPGQNANSTWINDVTVYAQANESLQTTMERAAFRMTQRRAE